MIFGLFIMVIVIMVAAGAWSMKKSRIVLGKAHILASKILNEKRKIWVYTPPGMSDPENRDKRYPVIYMLDGNAHFSWSNKTAQQLCGISGIRVCRDMIIVAITNTDRIRDFTPTPSSIGPEGNPVKAFETSGGGEVFIDFIEKELVPYIDSVYPTDHYKAIFGHSLGGLTVMNILINRPGLFDAYVAIEPSMWWDGKKLLKQAHGALKNITFNGRKLYLGIANTMPDGMSFQEVRADNSGATAHMRSVLELANMLEANPGNGLKYASEYYSDCDHGSVTHKAGYDALSFLFGVGEDGEMAQGINH
ncbi:MAG: alpha/beta hydrolase-fold protein [Mucilaginibacter sp.]